MIYLALGDSILSDCFPGPNRGAAALVFENVAFDEFRGRDLRSQYPSARLCNLTRTGLKLPAIQSALDNFEAKAEVKWVVLSGGGNDVLLGSFDRQTVVDNHRRLLDGLRGRFPSARLAICNVYDPTQGTGLLESDRELGGKPRQALVEALHWLNGVIAEHAGPDLADLQGHCLGHPDWFQRDIEPSQLGASEIRRKILGRLLQGRRATGQPFTDSGSCNQ